MLIRTEEAWLDVEDKPDFQGYCRFMAEDRDDTVVLWLQTEDLTKLRDHLNKLLNDVDSTPR